MQISTSVEIGPIIHHTMNPTLTTPSVHTIPVLTHNKSSGAPAYTVLVPTLQWVSYSKINPAFPEIERAWKFRCMGGIHTNVSAANTHAHAHEHTQTYSYALMCTVYTFRPCWNNQYLRIKTGCWNTIVDKKSRTNAPAWHWAFYERQAAWWLVEDRTWTVNSQVIMQVQKKVQKKTSKPPRQVCTNDMK